MVQIKKRKTDRRTIYTINVIKEAFLKLVKEEDSYIIPRVEVFKFNNGIITHRFN